MKYVSKALQEEISKEKANEEVLHSSYISPQKTRYVTSESPTRVIKGSGIGGGIVGSYVVSSVNKVSKGARSPSPSGFGSSSIRKVTPVFNINNNNNNNDLNKSNYESPMKSRSMSPLRVLENSTSNVLPLEVNNNVFDRLQLRGRVKSNDMRSWTSPLKSSFHSFSPRLDSKSLKMAEKGGRISLMERSRSASADNRSPKKYLRKSRDNSGNIVNINNNEDSRGRSRNVTPVRNQSDRIQSLSPDNSESNMTSSKPFILGSRIEISSLNKINSDSKNDTNRAKKKIIRPFTPILSAVETNKIMAVKEKTGETFEDRVNKSVECFYVQNAVKALTSRSSPGIYIY
jgi:hypothetical protein